MEQFAGPPRAQRLAADHRANAADRNEIRCRYKAAAPEKHGQHTEPLATGIDGESPELIIERIGKRGQEKPMMITSHPDTLADFGFISLLIVQLVYRCHCP